MHVFDLRMQHDASPLLPAACLVGCLCQVLTGIRFTCTTGARAPRDLYKIQARTRSHAQQHNMVTLSVPGPSYSTVAAAGKEVCSHIDLACEVQCAQSGSNGFPSACMSTHKSCCTACIVAQCQAVHKRHATMMHSAWLALLPCRCTSVVHHIGQTSHIMQM